MARFDHSGKSAGFLVFSRYVLGVEARVEQVSNRKAAPMPWREFLPCVPPNSARVVTGALDGNADANAPELRLYCERCQGERVFEGETQSGSQWFFLRYRCRNCRSYQKTFAVSVTRFDKG